MDAQRRARRHPDVFQMRSGGQVCSKVRSEPELSLPASLAPVTISESRELVLCQARPTQIAVRRSIDGCMVLRSLSQVPRDRDGQSLRWEIDPHPLTDPVQ